MSFLDDRPPLLVRIQRIPIRLFRLIAEIGSRIVWPFEWALSRFAQTFLHASERFEGIDSLFLWIGYVLAWPVRLIWRLLSAGAALMPDSVRSVLAAPFRLVQFVVRAIVVSFMRAAEALNLDGIVLWLVKWTRPVWYPIAALLGFMSAWLATRNFKQLLWALPLVLVLLPLVAIGGWTAYRGRGSLAGPYLLAVKDAREQKDYERIQLFERKLAQLGVATQLTEYQTALALAKDGDIEEAYERMQKLAPVDEPGYSPAHYWIVHQLLAGVLKLPEYERQRLTKVHLDHLQSQGIKGFEIDLMRAFWLRARNNDAAAADLLKPHTSRFPQAAIMRMEINMSLRRMEEARGDARQVRTHMEDRTRRNEEFTAQDYAGWTIAESILGNTPKAHSLAEQWLGLDPENKMARSVLLEISLRWFDETFRLPQPELDRLVDLFLQAAELSDQPNALQRQFAAIYQLQSNSPVAKQVVEAVVDSPETPAAILEAAGTVAATMGQLDRAKDYLQRAVKKDPNNAIAWNNYAWLVAQESGGDMDDALAAVNKALEISPDEFRFRETRGQIFLRLGQWKDAVEDLEYAANGMPGTPEIHLSLATAYDALGDTQLARVHREHAERPLRSR
jgi:tetratricopeptide (TPR) repeat protein